MPVLLPFKGLRPNCAVTGPLTEVVCPPYDVISESQRQELLARSPYNVVRVELPAGDYAGAASLFAKWKREAALVREAQPALYGYRMAYRDQKGAQRQALGVIGALVLEPLGQGVLPHEQTTPKDKTDRLQLIRALQANTSPVWCLCTEAGLAETVAASYSRAGEAGGGLERAVDDEGVAHELWPIFDRGTQEALARPVAGAPLLIADGHHRYETALRYQAEAAGLKPSAQPTERPDSAGPGAVLCLVAELNERYLEVMAVHRTVSGLPAGTDVLGAFQAGFSLSPASSEGPSILQEMSAAGAVGVVTPAGSFLAHPLGRGQKATEELDSARVDAALSALPPHERAYEHDVGRALGGVREGRLDAAVFCRPPSLAQIAATAHGSERMPPKTTFFWPKPRTGMVLRDW